MKSRITKIISTLGIIVAVMATILVNTGSVFAEKKTLNMPEPLDLLEQASEMRAITTIVNKCVPDDVKTYAHSHADVFTGTVRDTGPWLEKYFTGEFSDGKIRCNESDSAVLTKFASAIGHNVSDLLCNAENREYPGLINMVEDLGSGGWKSYKTNCDRFGVNGGAYSQYFKSSNFSGGASYTYKGKSYDNGDEYLRQVYNDWVNNKSGNPYIPGYYSSTQSQLGFAKYYIYKKDFFTQCGNHPLNDGNNGSGDLGIKNISKTGVVTTVYYEPQSTKTSGATIEGEMNPSCTNFKNRINDNYKTYRQELAKIYKNECNKAATEVWKFMYLQAKAITNTNKVAQVVTPEGAYSADAWEAQKSKIAQEKLSSWEKQGFVWKNYSETTDDDGNPVNKVTEFDDEVVTDAKKTITDYESYGGNYFKDNGESKGFECLTPEDYSMKTNPVDDDSDTSDSAEATCQNSGGAGSLGWIVCPILDWMQEASNNIYHDYVEPSLVLETDLFSDGNGTSEAWSNFQGFANVCFIILFLAIIFSQLTGVGIDNYGIKKLLPKLIVVAILVNLSYLICVICADLSNIVGNALNTMFDGFASGSITVGGTEVGNGAGATAITAVALVAAVFALGVAVWQNPAILLTLLVGALGVLIAIFFLFILLAARKAAIVVLTVISPLAFVCYMLPNTKKLFDRWLKFWEAMLLLYPICGLLVGGGNFASRLMLTVLSNKNGDDFFGYFSAMMIGIIPIFFIPTVLKSAFAAFGAIGSKIAGFGDRMRSGATRGIRNSERFKNAQERGQARQKRLAAQRRAGVYIDKEGNVQERRRPSAQLRRRLAGTRAGKALGMDRAIGQNTTAFLQQESARRDDIESMDLDSANATFAGVAAKAKAQRISDQETLIANGKIQLGEDTEIQGKNGQKIKFNAGTAINANDVDSLAALHASMLRRASAAKAAGNDAEYATAMDRVKAAQNLLSKTDGGRGHVQSNLEAAVAGGQTGGLSEAAGHLLDNHGDKYKSINRGAHAMISDLATKSINDVQTKLTSGEYDRAGVNKYTEESLAGADEAALQKLVGSMGSMSQAEKDTIAETAYKALNNPNIHTQPAVEQQLKALSAGYTPPAQAPQMISHGAYEDSRGNVYHLREMNDGKFLDDSGFEVDITHFKKH